ncbi:MAG: ATP-binding protein [Lentisphaeraceae bacterium]|nr:ATP-binding protein [Lentisphaeraceae bacterium]
MARIETMSYDFPGMRKDGSIYVDKTQVMYDLIASAPTVGFYFISRPRRFGKSLMISTLDSLFRGRKELFEGLAISKTDYDWPVHPVIRFDFSGITTVSFESFKRAFAERVSSVLRAAKATVDPTLDPGSNFDNAIQELYEKTGSRVVVLVDEYDAPIGHTLDNLELAQAIRKSMADFYTVLKANIDKIRFLMMTGVSKFSQVSIFSALNNIEDLTLDARAATMLGYTETELETYFHDAMVTHAQRMGLDYEAYRAQLRFWYNGYHFSPEALGPEFAVYNPYAIAHTLSKALPYFKATWASTGKPSMLMNYLSREQLVNQDYEKITGITEDLMAAADLSSISAIGLLFQAGYLTIKAFHPMAGYTLGIPDEEIRRDLLTLVTQSIAKHPGSDPWMSETINALVSRNFSSFFEHLSALYADLPYHATEGSQVTEAAYLRLLYLLLRSRFSSLEVCFERQQAGARPDLVLVYFNAVFIFELKVKRDSQSDAAAALAQIRERNYAEPLRAHNLPIYAIGLAFDPKTHRLVDSAAEAL